MPPQISDQLKRDFFWNTASSVMGSLSIVLLQLVVIRAVGADAGGLFALAFALGQQFQMLGAYEVRPFQATDVAGQFRFGTYHATRLITTGLMVVGILGYTLLGARPPLEAAVVMLVCFLRVFDAFEDVFYGEFQRLGRLDIAGRAFFLRTLVTTVSFIGTVVLTQDLLVACLVTIVLSAIATAAFIIPSARGMFPLRPSFERGPITDLLRACLPLFAASFLAMYLTTAPRLGIDHFLSQADQAHYAVLFMPALAINVLSLFIFRPLMTRMATRWADGDTRGFLALIGGGILAALGAFVVTFAVSWAIGIPLLGVLAQVDRAGRLPELLVLVGGGALNALGVILYYALVTVRRRHLILASYVVAGVVVTGLAWLLIPGLDLMGACLAYGGAMLAFALLAGATLLVTLRGAARHTTGAG